VRVSLAALLLVVASLPPVAHGARLGLAVSTESAFGSSEPSLRDVIRRAGDYVTRYHLAMETVIAEERYAQTLVTVAEDGSHTTQTRALLSDFLILSGEPGETPWMAFRDVLEVDGTPVRDRDDRMQRLFAAGGDAVARAMAINRESARYNLGHIVRTINTPIVALDFLLPDTQRRFRFTRDSVRSSAGAIWNVSFKERDRPTIIRTPEGRDVQARGSFGIDSIDGRVVETVLELLGVARITVVYAVDPRLQISVPVTMTEAYDMAGERLSAVATYSNYRKFETGVRIVPRKQ
jgi:hypothetical protein